MGFVDKLKNEKKILMTKVTGTTCRIWRSLFFKKSFVSRQILKICLVNCKSLQIHLTSPNQNVTNNEQNVTATALEFLILKKRNRL